MESLKVSSGGILLCLEILDQGGSEWQWQTLAYYDTTVKSFRMQATGVQLQFSIKITGECFIKSFLRRYDKHLLGCVFDL